MFNPVVRSLSICSPHYNHATIVYVGYVVRIFSRWNSCRRTTKRYGCSSTRNRMLLETSYFYQFFRYSYHVLLSICDDYKGIRDVISALESFLLLQRIYEADGTELYHVNHIQSIYIRALAETRAPLIRVAHMRLKEYLGTIPALLGLGCRNHLSDFEYIVQWPVELYGGLSR